MKKQVDLGLSGSDCAAIGDKRSSDEMGEKQERVRKRGKFRDLHSVLSSEGRNERAAEVSRPLDLNSDVCVANSVSNDTKHNDKFAASEGISLDLNAEDVSSSVGNDSFNSSKNGAHLKSRTDASECGSTSGPDREKDSLKVWKEMKENGFLSSSSYGGVSVQSSLISSIHGGIPMPKQRGRKSKSDVLKKKMELAKKEQVDRFTKIAAPSGLLNGLNPGIINHVRNKKQVHSIIEALVRSEKIDHGGQTKNQITETKQNCNSSGSGVHQVSCSQGSGVSAMADFTSGQNLVSHYSTAAIDNEALALRLSSKTKDDLRNCSNEKSANDSDISCLSVRAASVASQWLELLHQDIKGRLTALRRSRKKVRAVITTELPFLLLKEFASNQENNTTIALSAVHERKWSTLFDQMDKALAEEEKELESWLNNVKEMQLHCDQGLQSIQSNQIFGILPMETSESHTRIGSSERGLAVRGAAASIYSTCSFLMSKENVSCF